MTAKTHTIAIVNMTDGSVQAHAAGCKDLNRKARGKVQFADEAWELDVKTQRQAYLDYNADFIAESDTEEGHWPIDFMPCASHVPADAPAKKARAKKATPAKVETTMKVCGKWTRFYQNGVEVGRVANDAADAVFALIRS